MFSREIWALLFLVWWGALSGAVWADKFEKVPQANTRYDMLLSPQDVERVCATGGIRLVPKDPESGAAGILNFAFYRGPVMLMLNGEDVSPRDFAKQKQTVGFKAMYAFRFQGLGEDAYEGPAHVGRPYILSFQKGHHWITLTSGLSRRGGKPFLSMEQLRELAQLILERL